MRLEYYIGKQVGLTDCPIAGPDDSADRGLLYLDSTHSFGTRMAMRFGTRRISVFMDGGPGGFDDLKIRDEMANLSNFYQEVRIDRIVVKAENITANWFSGQSLKQSDIVDPATPGDFGPYSLQYAMAYGQNLTTRFPGDDTQFESFVTNSPGVVYSVDGRANLLIDKPTRFGTVLAGDTSVLYVVPRRTYERINNTSSAGYWGLRLAILNNEVAAAVPTVPVYDQVVGKMRFTITFELSCKHPR